MIHLVRSFSGGAARQRAGRLAAVFALLTAASPAPGQTLQGRVVRHGEGVPRASVEIHRITQSERGVFRRLSADPAGRFTVDLPAPPDSGFTVYLATAVADGVRYFGPVLHGGEFPTDYQIEVFDTTSAASAVDSVTVLRRDVILSPGVEGGWEVAELVRALNPTRRTLVPEQEKPVVGFPLPQGTADFEAGEGSRTAGDDAAGAELVRVGGRAWVRAPLVPGTREFVFRYRLPASPTRVAFPLGYPTDSLTLYVRDPAPGATVRGVAEGEPLMAEGERFRRFTGADLAPGAEVVLDWRGPTPAPVDPRWAALAIAGVILAVGGWLAWRRPRAG